MSDASDNETEYSVSELSFALKHMVESGFSHVRVRGELGRVARPASGHLYLDLKDDKAVLAGVIWKGVAASLKIRPEQGLEVICTGKLTTYPGQSKYQIIIEHMEAAGEGALMALFEARKKKLAAEGLFDDERKQKLPYLPGIIGVVTSPSGAVIRDILHRLEDRFPSHVIVWPVRVQGQSCAQEVAQAIAGFNALKRGGKIPRPELIIVARGGGSIEDLWGFNEEAPARAAAASALPVISAIGHETDVTLIDFAADVRAPTPSAAAEMAVPVRSELIDHTLDLQGRLQRSLSQMIARQHERLRAGARGLGKPQDLLALSRQRFDSISPRLARALLVMVNARQAVLAGLSARMTPQSLRRGLALHSERLQNYAGRLGRVMSQRLEDRRNVLRGLAKFLNSLSYHNVLERGFALVRNNAGAAVRQAAAVTPGMGLEIEFADDRVTVVAGSGSGKKPAAKKPKPKDQDQDQGNLL